MRLPVLLAAAVLLGGGTLLSQPAAAEPGPADTRITELQTAGYYELVKRAHELGLLETGGVPELRSRVAAALGIVLPPEGQPEMKTLTIDSAQEAGLISVDAPGTGKLLRLSGGLQVTLVDKEKNVTHVIDADELWYDQANEEMTARGQVVYTMIRETSREVFRGESLTFRLSDSQGIFYGGASDRARTVGDQTLTFRYQGDAIRRSAADLVVLDTGTITSSLGTDPYYRIKAKKIWVLAPGEWGLQDAVLYLGRIPVFYFPFFFQPGDDLFFNPVLSFPDAGDRRGTSLQTTTYLWGKKKPDQSPLSFLQVEDSSVEDERHQRGLYMVRGAPPPTNVPPNWTLRYLADFYSHLGFLTAVDASLPEIAGLKTFTASGGIGVTRTVNPEGFPFSVNPFDAELDPWAQSQWNGSWVGSWRLPFRWGGQTAVDAGWGTLSVEYYSDPLLYNDLFGTRSEDFSIFSLLGLGPAVTTAVATPKSTLQWSGSLNLPPASVSAGLLWDSKAATPAGADGDPENTFYLPSQMTLPQASFSFSGTLWPPTSVKAKNLAPELLPPADSPSDSSEPSNTTFSDGLTPPARFDNRPVPADPPRWTQGATWSLKPIVKTDTRFDTTAVQGPQDSSWNTLSSRWSGAYDGTLTLTSGRSDGSWTASEGLTLHQQTQDTWYQSSAVTATQSAQYELQDAQQTSSLLSQNLASSWKPFVGSAWRDSSLQYQLGTKLWEENSTTERYFDGTVETVTAHQASTQAVWYVVDGLPSLKVSVGGQSTLPPLEELRTWTGGLDLGLPWGAKASTKASAKQTETSFVWDPWQSDAEWTPFSNLSFKESYQYDLQNSRPLSSTTFAGAWGLTAQYRQQQTTPYRFSVLDKQWEVTGGQDFLPQELRFGYNLDVPGIQWWYYRYSLSSKVSLNWPINLQQYSQMPLTLNYTLVYKVYRFLDLQVTEGLVNRTAYRYFPALADSFGPGVVPVVNPVADLWDAVSVWDQAALRRTGFKMTDLTVSLVHYLDDWQIRLDYSGSPQLQGTTNPQFQWSGTLTLLVQWYPVPELKTQMQWDRDGTLTVAKNSP